MKFDDFFASGWDAHNQRLAPMWLRVERTRNVDVAPAALRKQGDHTIMLMRECQ